MTISIKERKAYGFPTPLQKLNPAPIIAQRAPKTSDTGYRIGQVWINKPNNDSYILTSVSANQAQWQIMTVSVDESAPISKYVVDADGSTAYTTIQSALNAANAAGGGIIYVRPGTYNENLTCYNNTQVVGAVGFADTGDCVITGKHTPPTTGTFVFRNIYLESPDHIFESAAAGASYLIIVNSAVKVTNGFTFNLPNWTGVFECFDINEIYSANNGHVNNTGGSSIFVFNSSVGAGTIINMVASGVATFFGADIDCPIDFQTGSVVDIDSSFITKYLTFSNNSTGNISNSHLETGSLPAIVQNSSNVIILSNVVVDSTATPAISGTGTIKASSIAFLNDSSLAGSLTLTTDTAFRIASLGVIEGTNATSGITILVAGTITVNTTKVTANSRIQLTHQNNAGTPGFVSITARVVGTSFTVTSSSATDTSTIAWLIVEPQ